MVWSPNEKVCSSSVIGGTLVGGFSSRSQGKSAPAALRSSIVLARENK